MKDKLEIYKNKKILITGHTGFKGSWLSIWLKELGARIIGYALDPYTERDNFVVSKLADKMIDIRGDVRDYRKLKEVFKKYEPEIVFHLAARSLVIEGYNDPKETLDVNIGGSVNILENCRLSESVRIIVNVTSDKCYENKEWVWGYRENDPLAGFEPYSASKACSELVTSAYGNAFFNMENYKNHRKVLSSARSGNVIGGGDWREDRIVPDCVRYLEKGEAIRVRNPLSIRPWQFVLEPLGGYLLLGANMFEDPQKYSGAWNFGPGASAPISVKELVVLLLNEYGTGRWIHEPGERSIHETSHLSLDISKAKFTLGWRPCFSIEEAIAKTVDWYKSYRDIPDMYDFCKGQIGEYMERWSPDEDN